ncbi:uncharacterized protein LOC142107141 [Mixophyes fleayi]|uniref:uncharacterized protein LOC142107141 n=1 Tax=Mixophyes fleayi TaxID=3061075 RepID=UPI003F4D96E7
MKILLLLALLFFTGAQGRYLWQKDEPKHEDSGHTLQKMFQNAVAIVTDVVKNLEYSEIAKEYKIKEKLQAAKHNADEIESVIEDYFDEIWKKGDEELHARFPVFRTNVVPLLEDFDNKLEEELKRIVEEVVPIGSELFAGITKHVKSFLGNMETLAEKARDNVRAEIDVLRSKLQPYVDDVRAEYEKYSKDMTDAVKWKQQVEKKVDELREQAKPYFENLKKQAVPNAEELWKNLDNLIKELYISKKQ